MCCFGASGIYFPPIFLDTVMPFFNRLVPHGLYSVRCQYVLVPPFAQQTRQPQLPSRKKKKNAWSGVGFVHDKPAKKEKKNRAPKFLLCVSWVGGAVGSTLLFYSSASFTSYSEQNWGFVLTRKRKVGRKLALKPGFFRCYPKYALKKLREKRAYIWPHLGMTVIWPETCWEYLLFCKKIRMVWRQ